jgi:hypothetical protein
VLPTIKQIGSNVIPFVNALLNMNDWLINKQLGQAAWQSPLTARLYKYTNDVAIDKLLATHTNLVNLRGEIQRFIFPDLHLLTARLLTMAVQNAKR